MLYTVPILYYIVQISSYLGFLTSIMIDCFISMGYLGHLGKCPWTFSILELAEQNPKCFAKVWYIYLPQKHSYLRMVPLWRKVQPSMYGSNAEAFINIYLIEIPCTPYLLYFFHTLLQNLLWSVWYIMKSCGTLKYHHLWKKHT